MRIELDRQTIEEIVEILAEELEVERLGLEEKEVLERIACLSVAVYLSKLNPENKNKTKVQ